MSQDKTNSIIRMFVEGLERHPEKPAICCGNNVSSYQELAGLVSNLSVQLEEHGVQMGDHVGVLLPNSWEFVVLMLTAANLGLVLVPHNMSLSAPATSLAFKVADVKHFVVWHSLVSDLRQYLEPLACSKSIWLSVGGNVDGCLNFETSVRHTSAFCLVKHEFPEEQPYILTMTSGSTGEPKPLVLSQLTKINRAKAAMQIYGVTEQDVTLAATPLYHSLAERLVLIPLISGGTSVLMASFSAKEWLSTVVEQQVSFSIAVSSQLKQILDELKLGNYRLDSLKCLVSSSERLDKHLKAELLRYIPCDFHECYGTSEISIATNLDKDADQQKVASVGKALPNVDVKILGDDGELVGEGQVGEIVCKTPMLFSGYYKLSDMTRLAMKGDYFCTGDLGKLDSDGFLYFLGRKKDIIITGGINVYPKDIEEVLLAHQDVAECAVIPLPDERLGEMVTAVVVPAPGSEINIRQLQRLSARVLADYQQPRHYVVVDKLPRNSMAKVTKPQLVKQLTAKHR